MNYRTMPKTGWKISEISFGCMSLRPGLTENQQLLHQAVDLGINYFDTADLYDKGENEKLLGKYLKPFRKNIFIATKVGNQWRPDGSGWDWNPSRSYILKAVKDSLKRLQTDYIDLYQLHGGTIDDPIDETIEAFETLKAQGLIRAYGISSIRPNVIRAYVDKSGMASVMMQYSLLDRRPQESCLPLLASHDIAVVVRGAVAKGLLIGKPATEYLNYTPEEVSLAAGGIKALTIAQRTSSQTALQFALKGKAVCTVAAGMRTITQLLENAQTSQSRPLTSSELIELQSILPINRYQQHR